MHSIISLRAFLPVWMHKPRRQELLDLLARYKGTVNEVALFTGHTHVPLPLQVIRDRAEILGEILPRFKALGIAAGINHHVTLGHFDENLDNSLKEPWQHLVDINGGVSKGCYCSADPAFQEYLRGAYVALARARPDFIWIDDDARLESHAADIVMTCFCPHCLADFSRQTGREWTRESLKEAFNGGEQGSRLSLRRQWVQHNRRYLRDLFALVRAAADEVEPSISLGAMTAEMSYSGCYEVDSWVDVLSGPNKVPVKWRPGGGFYEDTNPCGLLAKAHSIGRQTAPIPAGVLDIQYEHESFPYQWLRKSVTVFTAEIAAAIGAGCTGAALNCMGIVADPLEEFLPWLEGVSQCRGFYEQAVATFGRSPCEGLWPLCKPDHQAAMNLRGDWSKSPLWGGHYSQFNELAEIGLPMAYSRQGAAVRVLAGENVLDFSKDELLEILAGGVLLDAPALGELQNAGLSEHVGFNIHATRDADSIEQFTADEINGRFAGWSRDCRQAIWREKAYLLRAMFGARSLAEIFDFVPANHGCCAGVFENALGGRTAVLGYFPWRSFHTLAKTSQMKALCRWLSRDTLPAYVASYHKAALWCRRDAAGRLALLLMNASLDRSDGVSLLVHGEEQCLVIVRMNGKEERLACTGRDGPYGRFVVDGLLPWEAAIIRHPVPSSPLSTAKITTEGH